LSNILIIGRENAIRSQMMEGYLKKSLGNNARVYSCGLEPSGVDPQAIRAMAEDRVVIAGHTSDSLEDFQDFSFDIILTFEEELALAGKNLFGETPVHVMQVPVVDGFGGLERQEAIRELRDLLRSNSADFINQQLS